MLKINKINQVSTYIGHKVSCSASISESLTVNVCFFINMINFCLFHKNFFAVFWQCFSVIFSVAFCELADVISVVLVHSVWCDGD